MGPNFSVRELAVCALFGAMIFAEGLILGTAVISLTGIPATGSLLNMFFALMLIVIGIKLVPKFGAATLITAILGVLSIPTVINGPPGVQKVLITFLLGFLFDVIVYLGSRSNKSHIVAASVGAPGLILMVYVELLVLGLPGLAQLQPVLVPLMLANLVLGAAGAYTGLWVYEKKLKSRAFVSRIRC
ncbi:MAG: hypothetical protein JW727_05105 [Candidatus Aenigmarchaeota archaeon]|nr:hypothetical protein [Candidatus Aenigmarchaeota archaeon]